MAKFGCTPERLREIFTSRALGSADTVITTAGTRPSPEDQVAAAQGVVSPTDKKSNEAIRRRFEERLRARVLSGVGTCRNNSKAIKAVDMAWDAPPIQKETIPLMLWAQGKLNMEQLHSSLNTADPAVAQKFFRAENGKPVLKNIPRICDVAINLVRSMVTRRHAALDALWSNLWPLLKYDPRGTDNVAMLRADALTQRVDIMSDQYNYRHFLSQSRRTMLLYAWSMIFPRSKWDRQVSWRFKRSNATEPGKKSDEVESYVTREGVDFVNPHASRIFWDLGAPIANINTNNGPKYVGYWDIVTYGTILDGDYFNTDRVTASESWLQLVQQNQIFFSYYFDPCVLQWPVLGMCSDPSLVNDRSANIGVYTADMRDKGVLLTQEFELINPKKEGIGDYDADVWLRLVAAGDGTIVAAEFMPSLPGCYGGINCNDGRVANESLAMELLGFQDQLSNIISQMIAQLRSSFTQLWLLDKDSLDPKIVKDIEDNAGNKDWWIDPHVLVYSATKLKELGIMDPRQAFVVIQPQIQATITASLQAIGQVLNLADRIINTSPNEQGQPNPREVSATETQSISTTIQSIYAFINQGPREQQAAFKELIYESLVCCATEDLRLPVVGRYTKKTIKAAGFDADGLNDIEDDDVLSTGVPITGNLHNLIYEYLFDSRDGAERVANTQGAQVLQQLLAALLQVPGVIQKLGLERIFDATNVIARMAGAPDEFKFEMEDGESDDMNGEQDPNAQLPPQVQQAIQKVMQEMQQMAVKDGQLEQVVAIIAQKLGITMPTQQGAPPPTSAGAPGPAPAPQGPPPSQPPANPAAIIQNPIAA